MNITEEFSSAELGDARRTARLVRIAEDLARDPQASFPKASQTEAATEATYRLLRNEGVTPEAILQPHLDKTIERALSAGEIVVAHDTTEINFSTNRKGLGRSGNESVTNAFFLHAALAVSESTRAPLGIAGARRHVRQGKPTRKKTKHSERKPEPQRESRRWWELMEEAAQRLEGCSSVIHVADREAEQFLLFARCVKAGIRFVIRGRHDRHVLSESGRKANLRQELRAASPVLSRAVDLTPRAPKFSWLGRSKKGRRAKLALRACAIQVARPESLPSSRFRAPATLHLHAVHVTEIDPPDGFEPVDWLLLTTESITTPADIARIVDIYAMRWVIEEYFKALKTGCAVEKRQLESSDTIFNALAIFMPIAVQLLALKHAAVLAPDQPAATVLSDLHVRVLQAHPNVKLPAHPSTHDCWYAVAGLGGHLRQNGPPGWQTLWKGMLTLNALVDGVRLAKELNL